MQLNPLEMDLDLLTLFRQLGRQRSLSCFCGFADNWSNLVAFDSVDELTIHQAEDLDQLYAFVEKHQGHLIVANLSYDLGLALHSISSQHQSTRPLVQLIAYDSFIINGVDGLATYGMQQQDLAELNLLSHLPEPDKPVIQWFEQIAIAAYRCGFDTIQDYIRRGDIYQINYTHQLQARSDLSATELFAYFMTHKPVSHAAFIATEDQQIISLSPEGFIEIDGRKITTQPIKGTRPRSADPEEDLRLREELITSEKEQAELFMIVDLLRNDLGKVCETGSVRVVDPKIVTAMPNVWHTHATIQGLLKDNISVIDALLSMFPGGSITGCPKHRAMEIIDELETSARGLYTGSIGYILPDGSAAFNIAIRTLIKTDDSITLGVGGGITIKSDGDDEYNETLAKAAFFKQGTQ